MLELALTEILLAKRVSAEVVERSHLLSFIGRSRVRELLDRAANLEAANDLELAYAYRIAAAAVQGFPQSSVSSLARSEGLVQRRLRLTVVLRTLRAVSPAFSSAFERAVRQHLPTYLRLDSGAGGAPDVEVSYSIFGPRRQFKGHVETEHTNVVAYEATVPNPAYSDAQSAYNDAVDDLHSAQEQYQILHEGANNLATQASQGAGISAAISAVAALGSGAEEAAGLTTLHDAQEKVAEARQRLNTTQRTIRETKMADTTYPSIVLSGTATSYFTYRIALRGVPATERNVPFSVSATRRLTPPVPSIGVAGFSDSIDLANIAPNLLTSADDLGQKTVAFIRVLEENRIWNAAITAANGGDVEGAAVQYVAFLCTESLDGARNKEAIRYLARNLK